MLTKKERQVLEFKKAGLKQNEIASKLRISQPAVSAFLSNALRKIRDASDTMDFARQSGINYDEEQ